MFEFPADLTSKKDAVSGALASPAHTALVLTTLYAPHSQTIIAGCTIGLTPAKRPKLEPSEHMSATKRV